MGILERMEEAKQRAIEQAQKDASMRIQAAEATRIKAGQDREKQAQERELAPTQYISDNEAIIALLTAIPDIDYDKYFKDVARFTGYNYRVALYSHPQPTLDPSHPMAKRVEELSALRTTLLRTKNLTLTQISWPEFLLTPSHVFFGHERVEVITHEGFLNLYTRSTWLDEPHLPGIGINFHKVESRSQTKTLNESRQYGTQTIETYHHVYVRFFPGSDVLITNSVGQTKLSLDSLKTLDDALEIGLSHPVTRIVSHFIPDPDPNSD